MSTKVIDSPPEPKIRENLGKFFYDIAKLTFAGMVIGSMVTATNSTVSPTLLIVESAIGTILTFIFAYIGFTLLRS